MVARKPRNARRVLGVERPVARQDRAGDGDARGLAATRQQRRCQLVQVVLGHGAAERARQQLAALLGDGAEQLLQEGNVHGNFAHSRSWRSGPHRPSCRSITTNSRPSAVPRARSWPPAPHLDPRRRGLVRVTGAPFEAILAYSKPSRRTPVTTETYEILAIKYGEFTAAAASKASSWPTTTTRPTRSTISSGWSATPTAPSWSIAASMRPRRAKRGRRIARTPARRAGDARHSAPRASTS